MEKPLAITHLGLRLDGSRVAGIISCWFFWGRSELWVMVLWRGWRGGDFPTVPLRFSGRWCSIKRDTDSAFSCSSSSESPSCSLRASVTVGWPWTTRPFLLNPTWKINEATNYHFLTIWTLKRINKLHTTVIIKVEGLNSPIGKFPVRLVNCLSQAIIQVLWSELLWQVNWFACKIFQLLPCILSNF